MKRSTLYSALVLSAALVAPVLYADVKTTEKTTFKLEGLMGAVLNRAAGGADGITSTVALKGSRLSRVNTANGQGQIIDLAEEKVYTVDTKKKEYSVLTFAQMRQRMEEARANMAKQQQEMNPQDKQAASDAAKKLEFDVEVKATGQTKTISGQDTRETVLTLTMREAGKKLEEGGGMVVTSTMWLAPRVAALDELAEFNMKYFKAVFGGMFTGADGQQMSAMTAMMPSAGPLMERMAVEGRKMQGTPLSTTTLMETVKSPEQMASAPQSSGGGGGLGGMLASRMMRRGPPQARSTFMTTTHDILSIGSAVVAEDVAIPANFKEKK